MTKSASSSSISVRRDAQALLASSGASEEK